MPQASIQYPKMEAKRGSGRLGRGRAGGWAKSRPKRAGTKRANPRNMKKTTQRGAYKPARKKQMAIRRAPLVETYKYQSAPATNEVQALSRTTAYNMILNRAFIAAFTQSLDVPSDGLSTTSAFGPTCRGRDIFSKLTSMKLRFDFPENEYAIRSNYTPPQLIHGWIKKTMFKTSDTTPTPAQVDESHFTNMINQLLTQQFNEANDKLDFRDRRPSEFIILGKQSIKPNLNKSINHAYFNRNVVMAEPGDSDDPMHEGVYQSTPPVFRKLTWKLNRKIGLQESTSWASPTTKFYPSDCWIPFVIVFNPSYAKQVQDTGGTNKGQIHVSYNSVHYYTDS